MRYQSFVVPSVELGRVMSMRLIIQRGITWALFVQRLPGAGADPASAV